MKKFAISALFILLMATLLISCGPNSGSSSPGNLVPTQQPTPHLSTGEVDVSSDYALRLCTDYWLDTNTVHCCSLNEDGTYIWMRSKKDTEQIASGHWRLTKDDQKFLTLYLKDDVSGEEQVLHELELYESSIYAVDSDGNGIVWLITEKEGESAD